jgi:hypothetical protein
MMNELEPLESDEIFMKFIMRVVKLLKWKLHDLLKKKSINFRTFLLNNKNIFHENDIFLRFVPLLFFIFLSLFFLENCRFIMDAKMKTSYYSFFTLGNIF